MKYYKGNKVTYFTGNPVAMFFFNKSIPWQFRLAMFLVGRLTWGTLFFVLFKGTP